MILQPSNVELTKIHFYKPNTTNSSRNFSVNTISQYVDKNSCSKNVIIKKNIFGHRWVLKINDDNRNIKNPRKKWLVYPLVFFSVSLAVGFGIFVILDNTIKKNEKIVKIDFYSNDEEFSTHPKLETINSSYVEEPIIDINKTLENSIIFKKKPYCANCLFKKEICMKLNDTSKPECISALDEHDLTGCGGLCQINIEFCQILSKKHQVYRCLPIKTNLNCREGQFNCGNMCINAEKRCDGLVDCSNMSDEQNCTCNYSTHIHCGNKTSCIPKFHICDKKIDCWDNSDEDNCNYAHRCNEGEHPCNNGFCIKTNQFCDGLLDCIDKSDEPDGCLLTKQITLKDV